MVVMRQRREGGVIDTKKLWRGKVIEEWIGLEKVG